MSKILRRRSAVLAAAAVAVALLFATNVASALPGAGGGQDAGPAAPVATAGAPHGAAAPPTTLTAMPDACPRGLSAAQADRQAQQLASQRGSRSTSQVAPNSNCCPVCEPPTTHPPTTCPPALHSGPQSAPQAGCGTQPAIGCTVFAHQPYVWLPGVGNVKLLTAWGTIDCTDLVPSISMIVILERQQPDGTWREVTRNSGYLPTYDHYYDRMATVGCVTGTYRTLAQATVSLPPGYTPSYLDYSHPPASSLPKSITC